MHLGPKPSQWTYISYVNLQHGGGDGGGGWGTSALHQHKHCAVAVKDETTFSTTPLNNLHYNQMSIEW